MSERLYAMGVLADVDENALARYCQIWERWRDCEAHTSKHGQSFQFTDKNGSVSYRLYPEAKMSHTLAGELRKLETEFGMTPSSRSRVETDKKPQGQKSKARFFEDAG